MEKLQRELQVNSGRIVKQAKKDLERLSERAFQCRSHILNHIPQAEDDDDDEQNDSLESLRQQKSSLVNEMSFLERVICTFDSRRSLWQSQMFGPMLGLSSTSTCWTKGNIIAMLCWYFAHGHFYNDLNNDFRLHESWMENAPESIRCDRDIILCYLTVTDFSFSYDRVSTDGRNEYISNLLDRIPAQFWDDKDIVVTAVKQFPEVLRQDRVPSRFLNDEDVFMAFAALEWSDPDPQIGFWSLVSRFSANIRASPTLMLLLVKALAQFFFQDDQQCFLDFNQCIIEESLKKNSDFRIAALEQLVSANFSSLHTPNGQLLLQRLAPNYNVAMLVRLLDRDNCFFDFTGGRLLYESAPEELQCDQRVVDVVLRNMHLTVEEFPEHVPKNRAFWLSACQCLVSSLWQQLPREFKDDPEFLAACRFVNERAIYLALDDIAELANSREFWIAVIESEKPYQIGGHPARGVFPDRASLGIRQDRELMLYACTKDCFYYVSMDGFLQADEEILEAAIDAYDKVYIDYPFFSEIPKAIQSMYPRLAAKMMWKSVDISFHEVEPSLLSNVDVAVPFVLAYTYHGESHGRTARPPRDFPPTTKSNQEFGLSLAEHLWTPAHWHYYISEELRSNKEFMKKVVARNLFYFDAVAGDLSKDFDITVIALSQHIARNRFDSHTLFDLGPRDVEFLKSVAAKARDQVVFYDWFTKGFLPSLIDDRRWNPGPNCQLPILIQDEDTTEGLKQTIKEFVGVPDDDKIDLLRAASLRLLFREQQEEDEGVEDEEEEE